MNNRRSYLDAMNAGRRRRSSTSLEQLSRTLDDLESRIGRTREERATRAEPDAWRGEAGRGAIRDHGGAVAEELNALRQELRQQMGSGLRHEFAALKEEIERALHGNAGTAGQAAELGAEFDRLSGMIHALAQKSDDRQVNLLRLEMEEVKSALGKLAREETVKSFDRRWDELDRRWDDIASKVGAKGADDPALQALGARLEQIGEAIDSLPTSTTLRSLEERLQMLSSTVDQFAHQQDRIGPAALDAIEDRLNEISRAVAASAAPAPVFDPEPFERIEARISSLARQIGEATDDRQGRLVADHLAALSHRVEDLAHRVDVPDRIVARLADQIGTIAQKLDGGSDAPGLDAVLAGMENRFSALSSMLAQRHEDALVQGQALFRDLERRLEDVTARLGERESAAQDGSAQFIEAMDARFAELASRLQQQVQPAAPEVAGVDADLIRSLEAQIAGLASHLSGPGGGAEAEDIRPRLDKIEERIADSRDDVIEAARRAAEDAVRSFSGSAGDASLVAGLAGDLKSLEELTRRSDDRNARTFEAIHDTLLKIVDRLGALENARAVARDTLASTPSLDPAEAIAMAERTEEPAAPQAEADIDGIDAPAARRSMLGGITRALAGRRGKGDEVGQEKPEPAMPAAAQLDIESAAVEVDPPLAPEVANRPLEPGSGAPDLNAIMKRVRGERGQAGRGDADAGKADFIAAARRAAQAAAAEAEAMKRAPAAKDKSKGSRLGRLFGVGRKPVLMGVAAVLIALAALQGGRMLLGGEGEVAQAPAPVEAETAARDLAEDPIETGATGMTDAPQQPVRMAGEAALPRQEAHAAITDAPASADEITTDWLDAEAATPLPVPEAVEEADSQPQPSGDLLASIPDSAGPAALREAAASGDPKALFEIGNRYAEGRGVPEDMAAAVEWYERAAEQGLAPAQYRVGNLYEKGIGAERDVARAKTWYQLAAAQGNASAMHNLAVLHAMGADGVTDNESAARWFNEAAEYGVTDSQYNLAILSAKGAGVEQDLEAAYKWFALVAKTGDKDAAEKRDEVAKALSPERLEQARAAAEAWQARPADPEANDVELPESWSEGTETTASIDMRQAVRNIQQILNANGYQAGSEDGLMGQRTQAAIAAFQKDNGMEPTGEIDEKLVRALLERT